MAKQRNNKKIINSFEKGLNLDMSAENQPKGTYRYGLNLVTETEEGDLFNISSEESNKLSVVLPDKIILGKVYMSKNEVAILSTNSAESLSYIGIFNLETETYENFVEFNLGFTKTHQFDIVYRLRRGCERVIYFTDNNIRPMRFNFDKVDNFKQGLNFSKDKFFLQKSYNDIPMFRRLEVVEGGRVKPGGYVFGIQYLDEDLNPTDVANISSRVKIYSDKLSSNYVDITGSASLESEYYNVVNTSKAIKIDLYNLDPNYRFYRLVILKYNNGSGRVSEVTFTDKISNSTTSYIYTGFDFQKGTLEEVQQDNFVFHKIKNLIQLEDQLVISNVSGNPDNLCEYQKFASKIKSRVVLKKQILTTLNPGNNKHPTTDLFSVGYMPGEIYSFGIVYLFKDGTRSPVYHIPGIPAQGIDASLDYNNFTTAPFRNMSLDNKLESFFYDKRDTCNDYWGTDFWGNTLEATQVRHHRFPTRQEANSGFVFDTTDELPPEEDPIPWYVDANFFVVYDEAGGPCSQAFTIQIDYDIDGVPTTKTEILNIQSCTFFETRTIDLGNEGPITNLEITILETSPEALRVNISKGDIYRGNSSTGSFNPVVKGAYIFGIEFSNVVTPTTNIDNPIIGYEIVRQDRTEVNRTVIDTGVLTPIINNANFAGSAHIFPRLGDNSRVNEKFRGLISPQFLFNADENTSVKLKHVGNYVKTNVDIHTPVVQDVQPGTSYDSDANKKREKDVDGYTLGLLARVNRVNFEQVTPVTYDPDNLYYLDAISSFVTDANDKEIFNVSSDNKTAIVEFDDTDKPATDLTKLPYVVMTKDLANPYGDYLTARFYKQELNPVLFTSSGSSKTVLYGGDSFISPMTYTNTYFIDVKPRKRSNKSGFFKIIIGVLLSVAAVVVTVITAGAALPITKIAIQYGISLASAGLKQEKLIRAYNDLWDKGLKETVIDSDVQSRFTFPNPEDDEIQWMSDIVEDLWFESNLNFNLRLDIQEQGVNYIKPLRYVTGDFIRKYMLEKLTVQDSDQGEGRLYKGFATAEYYKLNNDYDGINDGKVYYQIPYEYSCCTNCRELFPHRVHSSLKSFSEEFTDNFLKFLPNDYKDISGETGPINNMFVQNNRLYLHTEEGLWLQPAAYQERVTNEIVSFIGTGSLFQTPEQKIVDDNTGNSVGLSHKWGAVLSKHGYFFPSSNQNKVYLFTGKIEDLSLKGLSSWFKASLKNSSDNPSNNEVGGFIAGYDPQKERFLLTNKSTTLPWTLSYCIKSSCWRSFHSYNPNVYISGPNKLFTWTQGSSSIWKHNIIGTYQRYYGERFNQELEYISVENPMMSKITTSISLFTTAKKYNTLMNNYSDIDTVTYSKVMLYNSKQNSGELTIQYQDNTTQSFFKQSVRDIDKTKIRIGRVDKDWSLNSFRDYVVNYTEPMFIAGENSLEINKVLNSSIIDYNKNWSTLQSFKDKYLAVKYVFNNFEDIKLTTRYTTEDFEVSLR